MHGSWEEGKERGESQGMQGGWVGDGGWGLGVRVKEGRQG